MADARTPWAALLRAAVALGLPPAAFWALSLKEWRALTEPVGPPAALDRAGFEALAARYPDGDPTDGRTTPDL